MAPRRGGGGGYSSGSSSCSYCTEPMLLGGSNWMFPVTTALFAMNVIAILVLIACLVLTRRFKWIRERGTDKLRNSGYFTAALFMLFFYFMVALYQALGESDVVVTYMAYLGYMIRDIFYRVAHVLIIAIIARTITEDVGALSQKICSYAVGLLWIITLVGLGFDIAYYAEFIAMGGPEYIAAAGTAYTAIVEASYLFAFTLYLITLSVLAVLKQSSKGTLLMLIAVMPSLFLMNLIDLVRQAVYNFGSDYQARRSYDLYYANQFIAVLATMIIFLVVALIGGLRQRHSAANGMTQDPKFALPGPHYVAVGPYAPPPAPYNPHGTQLNDGQAAPYGAPAQPFQYVPPQYGPGGQQQMQYAQYPAPGQFAPQQHAEMSNTPAAGVARSVSPIAPSTSPYGAPSSSVSPPPPHDPYQMHSSQKSQY